VAGPHFDFTGAVFDGGDFTRAVDMLAYPEGTGPLTTALHRALQVVRENFDYLERFLGPSNLHDDA
jgi:hypothetical protein